MELQGNERRSPSHCFVKVMLVRMENRTKPYVFSHKARPGVDVGNLVCATGAA